MTNKNLIFHIPEELQLKKKDLTPGRVYLAKDGRLLLYLGTSVTGLELFYFIVRTELRRVDGEPGVPKGRWCSFVDDNRLSEVYEVCMQDLLRYRFDRHCLLDYSTIPHLIGEMYFQYELPRLSKWFESSGDGTLVANLNHTLAKSSNSINEDYRPVGARELQVGHVYVTGKSALGTVGEGHRGTYVYLGRRGTNFRWLFIGSASTALRSETAFAAAIDTYGRGSDSFIETKQNMRVYRPVYWKQARQWVWAE